MDIGRALFPAPLASLFLLRREMLSVIGQVEDPMASCERPLEAFHIVQIRTNNFSSQP
jgi:hypothetical protein